MCRDAAAAGPARELCPRAAALPGAWAFQEAAFHQQAAVFHQQAAASIHPNPEARADE
jgi:hypothetical protein